MAVTIATPDAQLLRKKILAKLEQQAVVGWGNHGQSFTLTSPEWSGKAWVRAFPEPGQLVLGLVPAEGVEMSKELYAVYQARLIEMLLTHFQGEMSSLEVTAAVSYPDLARWTGESQHAPRAE
jgi:hypothetical protein